MRHHRDSRYTIASDTRPVRHLASPPADQDIQRNQRFDRRWQASLGARDRKGSDAMRTVVGTLWVPFAYQPDWLSCARHLGGWTMT
jgi:hypothetical protein